MSEPTVAEVLAGLAVTRLAHFTPARNVPGILKDGMIRSSKDLADAAPESFSPTDRQRFDAHPDHVCCSFEYPNVYYLRQARAKPEYTNYPDWACLLINRRVVERDGTLFCGCNAAKGWGGYLRPGGTALADLWADPSIPVGYHRGPNHHPAVPTDMQAEVLVPGPILLSDVHAIVVKDAATAAELFATYQRWDLTPERLEWRIAPSFFAVNALVTRVRNGGTIEEIGWEPEGAT
ncbi:DarT ssDNA thymidine ADP-ribosyltransferase family protein [Geodermatophilus sp. SYSU D00691]